MRNSFLTKSSEVGLYSSTNPSRRYLRRMEVLPTRGAPRTTMRLQFWGLVEDKGSGRCSWPICRCREWPWRTRAASWSSGDLLQGLLMFAVVSCLMAPPERVFFSCFHWAVVTLSIPKPALIPAELKCCDACLYASKTFEDPADCPSTFPWNWAPSKVQLTWCATEVRMEEVCASLRMLPISIVLGRFAPEMWRLFGEPVRRLVICLLTLVCGTVGDVSCIYIGSSNRWFMRVMLMERAVFF